MYRLFAYIPLATAICLIALDVALIAYTSMIDPAFPFAAYFGISSIAAIFFAVIGRYTVGALTRQKIEFNYDKIAKTAHRMELADSRRKATQAAARPAEDTAPELVVAQAS